MLANLARKLSKIRKRKSEPKPIRQVLLRNNNSKAFYDTTSKEFLIAGPAGTGKTLANLWKIYQFGQRYPGARMLIVRKTRRSLTESALVTWERDVLGSGHPMLLRPINRGNRHEYRWPNQSSSDPSVLVTGGMDRPDKVLSTEWDLIYVPESTDLSILEWEQLAARLRAGAGPYDQIIGDCNPTTPTHWLYKRCQADKCKLYPTTHRDNPRYWDTKTNEWTESGRRYVVDRLSTLTGARKKRFLEGIWATAEGLVFDGYESTIHVLPAGWKPPTAWTRYWSIDWGYIDPMVIQFWAADGDGRMYLYRELFRSHMLVEDAAKWARALIDSGEEREPDRIVADHDPECVATFAKHSNLNVKMADKADRDKGIQAVQSRLDVCADGRPRLFFVDGARSHPPDYHLSEAGRPTSTLEEIVGYTWDTSDPDRPKDKPVDKDDHGMDCMRYGVMAHDGPRGVILWA